MSAMPVIENEVRSMVGLDAKPINEPISENFGAKDIFDLSWRNLLEAYTCTECGRCTSVCPANLTGKKLSPRKIMMDIRDRTEEIGQKIIHLDQMIGYQCSIVWKIINQFGPLLNQEQNGFLIILRD